ncbi:MAG: sugar ABC transporter ATP-binding protein, partial [Pseudomonadota bacterium]|nr:sugar ABC transporter ATP-binding protein [Pseudomonadota bacterium]
MPAEGPTGPSPIVLSASGISKSFIGVRALQNVEFQLRAGEVHALMGENGAGKSTLMKIFSGVYPQYDGVVQVDGQHVRFASVRDAEAAGIAIIHQELNLVPELSIAENIWLGREPLIAGLVVNRRKAVAEARMLLSRLGIDLDPEARISSLRIGEQQLVEIAKALSISARILIMDEPTSALSPGECRRLFRIIQQLAADGVAIVYISHRIYEVMLLSDRVTVLRDGTRVLTASIRSLTQDKIIAAMVGRDSLGTAPAMRQPTGRVVLSVRDLSLELATRTGWRRTLDGISFDVAQGEILGIGGLLGSGRTEILETIFGSSAGRRGGEIRLGGKTVSIGSPREARRLGLALVTEDRKAKGLHLQESIRDNAVLPSLDEIARFSLRSFAGEARLANRAVKDLAIRCTGIGQIAGTLSGGNQQKLVIAKWLATEPRVLLLDEPTRGIDVGAKQEIYDLIFRLAERGLAIVLVSSELPELLL